MNIVYIANSAIPSRAANSVQVMSMCAALAGAGHSVTLIVPDRAHQTLRNADPFAFFGVARSFQIEKVRAVKRFPLGMLNYLFAGLAVLRAGRLKSDLIYTRDPVVAIVSVLMKRRVVLELHEPIDADTVSMKLISRLKIFHRDGFEKLVVITDPLRDYYKQFGCPADKIEVMPDAVDAARFEKLKTVSGKKGTYCIGYLGSLYSGRGVEVIFELAQLRPRDVFFVYGGIEKYVQKWRERMHGIENLHIKGHIPNAEVPAALETIDVLLMPYQRKVAASGNRGDISKVFSPMKMFEYMASGRPIISSNLPVLQEVLQHEENCLLVEPDDIYAWKKALDRIIDEPDLATTLATNARKQVELLYTWDKRVQRILESIAV